MPIDVPTPHGPARVHLETADEPRGILVLGHGAGGGVGARDLVTAACVAGSLGLATALVEQPYRVAGRRSPAPAHQLDAAWTAVVEHVRAAGLVRGALVAGGRSSGARVACRTAAETRADAVLCLAFPLHPPQRQGRPPGPSRLPELEAVTVPTLVVQGERDPFGLPKGGPHHEIVVLKGDHNLSADLEGVSRAAAEWLERVLRPLT